MDQLIAVEETKVDSLTDLFTMIHRLEKEETAYSLQTVEPNEKTNYRHWLIEINR